MQETALRNLKGFHKAYLLLYKLYESFQASQSKNSSAASGVHALKQ